MLNQPTRLFTHNVMPLPTQGGDAPTDDGSDSNAEEVEPFYALAQRCRLSGAPDMVLEVLNAYRAMASPGALKAGAPRYIQCIYNM